jgi:hypothetical protein
MGQKPYKIITANSDEHNPKEFYSLILMLKLQGFVLNIKRRKYTT